MQTENEKPWWFPELTDAAWCARCRDDYPDDTHDMDDEAIREEYADGKKYQTLWDHTGDAYDQFKELADAYLALLARVPPNA